MFKKTKLAAAILAAVATSAQAVSVSPDLTGEVLIYPYYNVNNDFQTNISVTNTKNEYKIVKIRFRESGNSQDVLDFNIYMSPYDVWTATVRNVAGKANVFTADNTCTLPLGDAATSVGTLKTTGFNMNTVYPDVTDADAREGYIELIEVGVIPDTLYADMNGNGAIAAADDSTINSGLLHGATGVPADCTVITNGWSNGVGSDGNAAESFAGDADADDSGDGLRAPSGGLYGNAIYLNSSDGAAYVSDAVAINNVMDTDTNVQHYRPDDVNNFLLPSLASGDNTTSTIMKRDETGGGAVQTAWENTIDATLNDGDGNTPRSGTNAFPIAHVLMATNVINDYFIDPNFNGATDWVVTFPMRKHGLYNGQYTEDCDGTGDAGGTATFSSMTEGTNTCFKSSSSAASPRDVIISAQPYDREEQRPAPGGFGVSPVIGTPSSVLPREVNIVTFASQAASVLGSADAITVDTGANFVTGWLNLTFDSIYDTAGANVTSDATVSFVAADADGTGQASGTEAVASFDGVPAIGFAAIRGDSGIAGVNFGETIPHHTMVDDTP